MEGNREFMSLGQSWERHLSLGNCLGCPAVGLGSEMGFQGLGQISCQAGLALHALSPPQMVPRSPSALY
jgi:hypothetical protein